MAKEKKSKKKTSKKEVKKEEVCEVFEISKEGKEKIIESCGIEKTPVTKKDQVAHQNKLLRNILITLGILAAIFVGTFYGIQSMNHFTYDGLKFKIIQEKEVTFYQTNFPSQFITPAKTVEYRAYLRNDPRELKDIPFEGRLRMLDLAVIQAEKEFNCDGDGVIAVANFNQILGAKGISVVADPEANCDPQGQYMYFYLKSGDETKIMQIGPSCYDLIMKDCEILDVTERFLLEVLTL